MKYAWTSVVVAPLALCTILILPSTGSAEDLVDWQTNSEVADQCAIPGMVPGSEMGSCEEPRQWNLAGEVPRLDLQKASFELKREFGQPNLSPELLRSGKVYPGMVELRSLFISVDPAHSHCHKFQPVGSSCMTYTVAEVTRCSDPCPYPVGTRLMSNLFWREAQIWPADELPVVTPGHKVLVIPEALPPGVALSHYVGVLGMPGWTAFSALFRVGNLTCPGETVFITGAAGVCGSMLGQMAKILGCRVIGTAGSDSKVRHLKEVLGFDEALNYKEHSTVDAMRGALATAAPEGIDFYFDNTAGHVTTAAWYLLNDGARVAICGGISHYYDEPQWWSHEMWAKELPPEEDGSASDLIGRTPYGSDPVSTTSRGRRIVVQGLGWYQLNQQSPWEAEFNERVPAWISAGKLRVDETILDGFETLPDAFLGLFSGLNVGKIVIKVNWPERSDCAA